MAETCDVCGNHYDKLMTIQAQGKEGKFDCFECAIQALAPLCEQCGVRVLGHGLEEEDEIYCCANCARMAGQTHFVDRVSEVKI